MEIRALEAIIPEQPTLWEEAEINVAVHEIKTRFSEYLRRMQAGEEIVVTARGKAVARLVPAEAAPGEPETDELARLDALPWVRSGKGGKPTGSKKPMAWRQGAKMLSEIVCEGRD